MRRHLIAVLCGVVGMGLALGLWHAYVDHQTWHVLLNHLAGQQRAAQAAP